MSPETNDKKHAESSPGPANALFKTIVWVKLLYWLNKLCIPGDLTMSMQSKVFLNVTNKWSFEYHLLSKTITAIQWALSLRRLNNEHAKHSLPVSLMNALIKTSKTYHINSISSAPGRPNNECAEHSLPPCDWLMAFSRPSSEVNYCVIIMSSVSQET